MLGFSLDACSESNQPEQASINCLSFSDFDKITGIFSKIAAKSNLLDVMKQVVITFERGPFDCKKLNVISLWDVGTIFLALSPFGPVFDLNNSLTVTRGLRDLEPNGL